MKSAPIQSAKRLRLRLSSLRPRLKLPYPSHWLRRVGSSFRLIQRRRHHIFTRREPYISSPKKRVPEGCSRATFAFDTRSLLNKRGNQATLSGIFGANVAREARMASEGVLSPGHSEQDLLEGWKAIADYLHKTERTVQRWEKTKGLPVRRFNASSPEEGSRVFASKSELDAWWQELLAKPGELEEPDPIRVEPLPAPPSPPPKPRRRVSFWVALTLAVAAI